MNQIIFRFLNDFALRNEFLDAVIVFFMEHFGLLLIAGLVVFIIFHKSSKIGFKYAVVIFTAALAAWFIAKAIKFFYFSPRPFEILDNVNLLFEHGEGDSFPSGHATFFSALAVSLYFYHKRIAIIYIAGALFIGLSRIIAGIHWPTDILAGYALGGLIGYLAYKFLAMR
jgi:undecaprenyl-diphosphatase|tara:strand:- start:3922 stop:4431 length:510 start_codon:yes stop_codon:yes gene_type:complete